LKSFDPSHPKHVSSSPRCLQVKRRALGFECATSLLEMLDEVIPWVKQQIEHGNTEAIG
jgi:hypothetical protein